MSKPVSSLPESWIERIWATMRGTYGAAFDRQWECPEGEDPVRHVSFLKAHWARELAGYAQRPEAIKHALDSLPEYPPNLIVFKALCRSAPVYTVALPEPAPDPAVAAAALAAITKPVREDGRQWARDLQAREENGAKLTLFQRFCYREALGLGPGATT